MKENSLRRLSRSAILFAFILGGIVVFASFVYCSRPIDPFHLHADAGRGVDFVLRLAEVDCLKSGINPFRVWNREISHPLYCSTLEHTCDCATGKLPINAYTPWAYTFIFPLSLIDSWGIRWGVFTCVRILSFLLMTLFFMSRAWRLRKQVIDVYFCGASLSLTAGAIFSDLMPSNFAVFLASFAVGLIVCLNSGYYRLAGFFWALMMVKPQIGLLFAIPLLLSKRYDTIAVSTLICLLAAIPPSLICGESMFSMIAQAPAARVHAFRGCVFMPLSLFSYLRDSMGCSSSVLLGVAALLGVIFNAIASWFLKDEKDWLVRFFPSVVFSLSWTYIQSYSHVFSMLSIFLIACICVRSQSWYIRMLCLLSIVSFSDAGFHFVRVIVRVRGICGSENPNFVSDCVRWGSGFLSVVLCMFWCVKRFKGDACRNKTIVCYTPYLE